MKLARDIFRIPVLMLLVAVLPSLALPSGMCVLILTGQPKECCRKAVPRVETPCCAAHANDSATVPLHDGSCPLIGTDPAVVQQHSATDLAALSPPAVAVLVSVPEPVAVAMSPAQVALLPREHAPPLRFTCCILLI